MPLRLIFALAVLFGMSYAADLRIKAGPTPDAVLLAEHPDKGFLRVYSTVSANLEFKCFQGCAEVRPKGGGEYLVILWQGEKNIVIKATGYSPVTVALPHEVQAKEAFRVDVEGEDLSGSKGKGNLQINSSPSAALIEVEGVPEGNYQTPYEFKKMAAMSYKVLLSKNHFQPIEFKIEVLRDQTVVKNVEFIPNYADFWIYTKPSGARISAGGNYLGLSPLHVDSTLSLLLQTYEFEAVLDHYQKGEFGKNLLPGINENKSLDLQLLSGLVHFNSATPNCQLMVDNQPRGGCNQNLELSAGSHSVHLSAPAYESKDLDLQVNQAEQYVTWDLSKQFGPMILQSTPSGASVYWQGKKLGITPINQYAELGSGELRVQMDGYEGYAEQVNWTNGPLSKNMSLSPKDSDHDGYPDISDACPDASEDGKGAKPGDGCPSTPPGMVSIPAGCFSMGSNDGANEMPVHNVCLSAYNIDMHEVSQGEYSQVMGENPSRFSECGFNCPVEQVDWNEAKTYCEKVGKRLPTEAEWEYAARGGAASGGYKYAGSNNPNDVAWYDANSGSQTHAVCTKQQNEIGLCDMSGNVWEWTADWYGDYQRGSQQDPQGASSGSHRVNRGGGRTGNTPYLRSADRESDVPTLRGRNLGFRCVQSSADASSIPVMQKALVQINANSPLCRLSVDGKSSGACDQKIELDYGSHRIQLQSPGYVSLDSNFVVNQQFQRFFGNLSPVQSKLADSVEDWMSIPSNSFLMRPSDGANIEKPLDAIQW